MTQQELDDALMLGAPLVDGVSAAPGSAAPVRACAQWLDLRRDVDTRARERAGLLLKRLVEHLRLREIDSVQVVDVGAGTGANRAYLSPRLPFDQSWVVVDHDADLLAHPRHGDAVRVTAGVCELVEVLDGLPAAPSELTLITCAALLDVLGLPELRCMADAIERSGAPALLSLSVTGHVRWSPSDAGDGVLRRAFDGHQRRGGRPGPDAVRVLRDDLVARGLTVLTARTPWELDGRRPELVARWLTERVEAASEHDPSVAGLLDTWLDRRLDQLASGRLAVRVQHDDLLVLPG